MTGCWNVTGLPRLSGRSQQFHQGLSSEKGRVRDPRKALALAPSTDFTTRFQLSISVLILASCSAVGISSTVVERMDSFLRRGFLHKNCSTRKNPHMSEIELASKLTRSPRP